MAYNSFSSADRSCLADIDFIKGPFYKIQCQDFNSEDQPRKKLKLDWDELLPDKKC